MVRYNEWYDFPQTNMLPINPTGPIAPSSATEETPVFEDTPNVPPADFWAQIANAKTPTQAPKPATKAVAPEKEEKLGMKDKLALIGLLANSMGGLGRDIGGAVAMSDEECKKRIRGGASLTRDFLTAVANSGNPVAPLPKAPGSPGASPLMNPQDKKMAGQKILNAYLNPVSPVSAVKAQEGAMPAGGTENKPGVSNAPTYIPNANLPFYSKSLAENTLPAGGTTNKPGITTTPLNLSDATYAAPGANTAGLNTGSSGSALQLGSANFGPKGTFTLSDEACKKNIKPASLRDLGPNRAKVEAFLNKIQPYKYEYKNPAFGQGEQLGVMAQDLEKSDMGKTLVVETPYGKGITGAPQLTGAVLASLANLNERLAKVEK